MPMRQSRPVHPYPCSRCSPHRHWSYASTDYPGHGDALFVIGVEGTSLVYLYAFEQGGTDFVRVAAFESGIHGVMELEYDLATGLLYVMCDDACDGRMNVFEIAQEGADAGTFVSRTVIERLASMPNLANEGFAIAPIAECIDGARQVVRLMTARPAGTRCARAASTVWRCRVTMTVMTEPVTARVQVTVRVMAPETARAMEPATAAVCPAPRSPSPARAARRSRPRRAR